MSISNKIRALLNMQGRKPQDLAAPLGISVQAVRNKLYRDSFSASDLIKIANALNCELTFIIDDNQRIILNKDDLRNEAIEP